jgi:DNA repair exonuclease SbcCD ATPase subunit
MDLGTVAIELYSSPPAEFVRARSAAVAVAKDAGEKDLARDIGKLSKPSTGAWLANLLVAHRRDELERIVAVGEELRAAEQKLDPQELRTLGRKRQQLIASVSRLGSELGTKAGSRASAAAVHELEQTLQAALADPHAADAVLTGVLVRGLTSNGVEPVDLSEALAVESPSASRASRRSSRPRLRAVDTTAAERDVDEARRKLQDAEDRADDAIDAVEALRKQLTRIGPEVDRLAGERRELRARLTEVEKELAARTAESDRLTGELTAARADSDVAERAVSRARERVGELTRKR